jgi:hypothetical protein
MTTFTGQVSTSTDDGEQSNAGTITLNGADIVCDASQTYAAFRIQNVTVAAGVTISAATLSLFYTGTKTATNYTIYGNNVANPSTLSTTTSYISGLAQTSQSASWTTAITNGQFNTSPSISSIVTALIALGGWASGNSMLFIFNGSEIATSAAVWVAYDSSPTDAEEISITYSGGSAPGAPTGIAASNAGPTSVGLTWTQGSGTVTDNPIQYQLAGAGSWTNVDPGSAVTSYTITGLTLGQLYFFQVAAENTNGTSAYDGPIPWVCGSTWTGQVSQSTDDAIQNTSIGGMSLTDTSDALGASTIAGFRFQNVVIAANALISQAFLYLYATGGTNSGIYPIDCQLATNAGTFTSSTNNLSGRSLTGDSASTNVASWGSGWNQSASIENAVQAVVNQTGPWVSGNAMVVVVGQGASPNLTVEMWDGSATEAAILAIFTGGPVNTGTVIGGTQGTSGLVAPGIFMIQQAGRMSSFW